MQGLKQLPRKTLDELKQLQQAGLSRIHTGLESGYDPILKSMMKGVTAAEHIDAGRKVKEAGFPFRIHHAGIGRKEVLERARDSYG